MSQIYKAPGSEPGVVYSVEGTAPIQVNGVSGVPETGNVIVSYAPAITPYVNAYVNSSVTNVTGDGTNYTVIFDTVTADEDPPDHDNTTGIFTAPISGNYLIIASVTLGNVTSPFTESVLSFSHQEQVFSSYKMPRIQVNYLTLQIIIRKP